MPTGKKGADQRRSGYLRAMNALTIQAVHKNYFLDRLPDRHPWKTIGLLRACSNVKKMNTKYVQSIDRYQRINRHNLNEYWKTVEEKI